LINTRVSISGMRGGSGGEILAGFPRAEGAEKLRRRRKIFKIALRNGQN
jgi:hypothetical protein